jgi:hypothetical protein
MRLIAAALCVALPGLATAQARQQGAAASTDSAKSDKMPSAKKWEIRLGGFMVNGERDAAFNNTVTTTTGSLKGVEVLMRAPGIGVQFRSSESAFGNPPDVVNADASLILGPPVFSVFLGAGKRALTSTLGTNVFTYARAGLQMTFNIGGTGLRAQFGGWGLAAAADDKERMDPGAEGEASILYSPPRIPLFVQLGYRNEIFKSKSPSSSTPEEIRGLRLGAGIQFGGK